MNRSFFWLIAVAAAISMDTVLACPPTPPTAILEIQPNYTTGGQSIALTGHNSIPGEGGPITSYEWDFTNDGSYDFFSADTTHLYSTPGTYTVRLTVTDSSLASDTAIAYVTIGQETTYHYDDLGNRTQVEGGTTVSYSHNSANMNQYGSVGGVGYSYDDNGNLYSDTYFTYNYDKRNRLVSVIHSGQTVASYKYDSAGRRISKTVGNTTTKYVYDGDRIILEYVGSGTSKKKYVYGNGIDEALCMIDVSGGQTYYYQTDALGSIVALTNSSGSVVERYSYGVYGQPTITNSSGQIISSSAYGNRLMFTGREYDVETGLYYYRARYYNPTIGRFLQMDPLNYVDGMNLYEYVKSRPIMLTDQTGTSWSSGDFVWHYWHGHGESVDLGQIGLLDTFKNAPSVFLATSSYRSYVMTGVAQAKASLQCPNKTSIGILGGNTTVTNVTFEIFSVGKSTFFQSHSCKIKIKCCGNKEVCWSYNCSLDFAIRDWFRDPVDMGFELPGGTPYPINASWTDTLSGGTCGK